MLASSFVDLLLDSMMDSMVDFIIVDSVVEGTFSLFLRGCLQSGLPYYQYALIVYFCKNRSLIFAV